MGTKTAAMSEELAKKRREMRDLEPTLMQARTKHEQLAHELRQLEGKLGALEQRQTAGAQATHLALHEEPAHRRLQKKNKLDAGDGGGGIPGGGSLAEER